MESVFTCSVQAAVLGTQVVLVLVLYINSTGLFQAGRRPSLFQAIDVTQTRTNSRDATTATIRLFRSGE